MELASELIVKRVSELTYDDVFYLRPNTSNEVGHAYINTHPTDNPNEVRVHSRIYAPGTPKDGVVAHTFLGRDDRVYVDVRLSFGSHIDIGDVV